MKKTHKVSYQMVDLLEIEVDREKALPFIKQMVDFWIDSENRLADNDGDYVTTWLKQLGQFILSRRRPPDGDEGWVKLDGKFGLKLLTWREHEFDDDDIEVS